MGALGELLLDFDDLDHGMSQRLAAGTPRTVLAGVVYAKLATDSAPLTGAAENAVREGREYVPPVAVTADDEQRRQSLPECTPGLRNLAGGRTSCEAPSTILGFTF